MNKIELRTVWGLNILISLRMLGMFMILPVLSTYSTTISHGIKESLIGLAIGIYGLTQALFQIPLGLLSDRISRKRIIIGGLLVFMIGSIIAATFHSIWGIIFGRALQGASAITSTIIALLSDLILEQNITKAMAIVGINFSITFISAIVLVPIVAQIFNIYTLFWITAILAILCIIITMWLIPDSKKLSFNRNSQIIKDNLIKVFFNKCLLKLNFGIMCLHILLLSNFIVLPKKLIEMNISYYQHWKIYLITIIISFIFIIPIIFYTEKKNCIKYFFLICIFLLSISEIIFWKTYLSFWNFIIGIQIFFIAFNAMEALLPSLISKEAPVGCKGTAMSVHSTSQFIGIAIGSYLGGLIYDLFNYKIIFLLGIIVTIIWLIVASTMKEPLNVSSLLIKIPHNLKINDEKLKKLIDTQPGVSEMLIIPEEYSIYLKIDNKITDRHKIEKFLNIENY